MRIYSACQKIGVGAIVFLYFCSNVVLGYSAESHFWGERRRAARGEQAATSPGPRSLLAGLPGAPAVDPLQSLTLDHRPGVGLDTASSLGKAVAESSDSRVHRIAQSILPFGNVRFVRESKKAGAPLVLHIQDVHGNLEAQQNIAEMVLALARDHNVRLVGLEGAWGSFATDEFRPYPDQDIVKKVGRHFLKKDFISGAEYAGLASVTPLTLWGIEDSALYQSNVDAVKQSLAGQVPAEEFLASLTRGLDSLKKDHYSPQLLAFDSNQSLYDQNRRGLGEYLQTLVDDDGRDLSTLSVQVPNVVRFLGALNEERSLNFAAVERERQELVKVLSEKLAPDEMQTLLSHSVDLRAGTLSHNAYHLYLRDLCARKGVSLGLRPSLLAYMHYVAVSEEIERDGLLIEMDGLVESAQNALIENSEQRKLVSLSRDAHVLKKLFANEMTPEEWGTYVGRQEQTRRLEERFKALAPKAEVQWPEDLAGLLSPFEAFCARAMDRNRALTQNLANKMTEEKQTVAVLVAGGFHTDGLMGALARQEASVLVLTPKIGPIDATHRYLNVFAQDPIPLEKIFTGEPIALKTLCALSEQAPSRSIPDGLHIAIVALSVHLRNTLLQKLNINPNELLLSLKNYFTELSGLVPAMGNMNLAMASVGSEGNIRLTGQRENKSFSIAMNENESFTSVVQGNGKTNDSNNEKSARALPLKFKLLHQSSKPNYSPWPATAIPFFVSIGEDILGVRRNRAVEVFAQALQTSVFAVLYLLVLSAVPYNFKIEFLYEGIFLIYSMLMVEFRRHIFRFNSSTHAWEIFPIKYAGTKGFLLGSELIFNGPFLIFSLYSSAIDFLPLFFWGSLTFVTSLVLRVGFNRFARQEETRPPPQRVPQVQNSPLIDSLLYDYQMGRWQPEARYGLPSGISLDLIQKRLHFIAQKVTRIKIDGLDFIPNGHDGRFEEYFVPELNVLVKVPPPNDTELNNKIAVIKTRFGGFVPPLTQLDFLFIKGKKHFNVIVQAAAWDLPTLFEIWPQNGHHPHSYDFYPTSNRTELRERLSERQFKKDQIIHQLSERGGTFPVTSRREEHLGLTDSNLLVAYQLDEIQLSDRPSTTGSPVPDVFEFDIRKAQGEELKNIFDNGMILPHSIIGVPFAVEFFQMVGMAKRAAQISSNVVVALIAPILETLAYGFGTPALAALFVSVPFGLGIVMAPVLVGFISAVIHVISWKGQGERVGVGDFVNWWVAGSVYSSFFALMPSTGWAGETPWELSGLTHILVNSAIVAGTTRRMGKMLRWDWLERLKPGSLIPPTTPNAGTSEGLTRQQLLNLRKDILLLVNSSLMPLEVDGPRRTISYKMGNYRDFIITVGKGDEFDRWIDSQLTESHLHGEFLKPLRIIDFMKGKSFSHLVTEVISEEHSFPPQKIDTPLEKPIQETVVRALCDTIIKAFQTKRKEIFSRQYLTELMQELSGLYLGDGETDDGRPSKSLMQTAAAVILAALKEYKDPSQLMKYLATVKSFREILAMKKDFSQIAAHFNRLTGRNVEGANFDFETGHSERHKRFLEFMNPKGVIQPRAQKSEAVKPSYTRKIVSPVPNVLPLNDQPDIRENLDLTDLLLNGGKAINLDLLFRSFEDMGENVVPQDAQDYRQFIRQMVRDNWGTQPTKNEWLASLQTQRWEGVALPLETLRGKVSDDGAFVDSLRWWVLGELWLAVAGPRDWFNWRFYVVLFRERVLFRHNAGFSKQERLARAASYVALLRAADKSVLPANENQEVPVAQKFDIDLLHGAVGATGPEWHSLLGRVYDSYNQILEQWTRISLWGQYVRATKPAGGIHIFDVDSLVANSTYDDDKQREVASALTALLMAYDKDSLAQHVFLVTSTQGADGSSTRNAELTERLKKKYGVVFNRVKDVHLLTQEQVHGLYTSEEGNAQPTILLDPLLVHLNLVEKANLVRFWTHDASRVGPGRLRILVIPILKLAERLQEFFKRRTFIQTFA
jgi:hypothetical protein